MTTKLFNAFPCFSDVATNGAPVLEHHLEFAQLMIFKTIIITPSFMNTINY